MIASHDVDLLETISDLLAEQDADGMSERRGGARRQYYCVQLVAPYDGKSLPAQASFRQVQCRDLSPSGFSFYSYREPITSQVVIALGAVPFKFFIADIVRISLSETDGGEDFLIGCRFKQRL